MFQQHHVDGHKNVELVAASCSFSLQFIKQIALLPACNAC
jgi:hypothetical protein